MLAVFLLSTSGFAGEQAPRFGLAVNSSDGQAACATFQGREPSPGQGILLAAFSPPRWIEGKITQKRTARCEAGGALDGVAYEVQLERNEELFFGTGVAVVAVAAKTAVESNRPVLFAGVNGQPMIFHECTSYEGVHLSAWQGRRRIWHGYSPLGYDVDPTCSKEESEGQ